MCVAFSDLVYILLKVQFLQAPFSFLKFLGDVEMGIFYVGQRYLLNLLHRHVYDEYENLPGKE